MQSFIVGGFVRDYLLNRTSSDKDWVVVGSTKEKMVEHGFTCVGAGFPVFLHPETKEEYALARKEIKVGVKHTDFVFDFSEQISLDEDLIRRDFTINTLVMDEKYNLIKTSLSERALSDLKNKVIDVVDPVHFVEDPLRILRCARFSAQLGFSISDRTMNLCKKMVKDGELSYLPKERIKAEFSKAFKSRCGGKFFEILNQMEALSDYCRELSLLFTHSPEKLQWHPEGNTGGHVISALLWVDNNVPNFERIEDLYWAVLFHDIGKPFTDESKFPSHHNHDELGADLLTDNYIQNLKLPAKTGGLMRLVAKRHMRFWKMSEMRKIKQVHFIYDMCKNDLKCFLYACFADRFCNDSSDCWKILFDRIYGWIDKMYNEMEKFHLTKEEINKIHPENRSDYIWCKREEIVHDLLNMENIK